MARSRQRDKWNFSSLEFGPDRAAKAGKGIDSRQFLTVKNSGGEVDARRDTLPFERRDGSAQT